MVVRYASELTMRKRPREPQIVFMKRLDNSCPYVLASCIDRAHHIRSDYKSYGNKKKCCSIIVCFISFRHRTPFYRNRKCFKDVRIKRSYRILKDVIHLSKEHSDLDYIQADVNCCLKVIFKDVLYLMFSTPLTIQSQ